MQKYLPTILAGLGVIIPTVSADVAAAIGVFAQHNPVLTSWLVGGVWVLYHFLPSPMQTEVTGSAPPKVG